jgi:hypothetical protein
MTPVVCFFSILTPSSQTKLLIADDLPSLLTAKITTRTELDEFRAGIKRQNLKATLREERS